MISCDHHDYIEIACMFKYPIKLTMHSGLAIEGRAIDTCLDANRNECIKVEINDAEQLVVLEDVLVLEVCVDNPHFKSVRLK